MSVSYGKGKKGKAGKLHSLVIRSVGFCEHCGGDNALQCAHIISRRYVSTYTDLRNAFCLCASCHRHFTDHPVEFARYVQRTWAARHYDQLYKSSREGRKADDEFWTERINFLQTVQRQISSGEITLAEARLLETPFKKD